MFGVIKVQALDLDVCFGIKEFRVWGYGLSASDLVKGNYRW